MNPFNGYVQALLTDLYQLTMAYAYLHSGKKDDHAVFDLFFRKNPFGGEFTIFAGLSDALQFVKSFDLSDEDIDYVASVIPQADDRFRKWLAQLDCSGVRIYSVPEGSVVFPHVPLMRVEGPLGICQLLETPLLNLTSYASLVATNAARMRLAAGEGKRLVEFGMRRAQGPDGAMTAARNSFVGGFDATSNMMAGYVFDIPVSGTQAHSFISSFSGFDDIREKTLQTKDGTRQDFVDKVLHYREELGYTGTNDGELAAFVAFAQAFPDRFLALVDTYDTLKSGVMNFIVVALALNDFGYNAVGIRLDSGDLSHLSKEIRKLFRDFSSKFKVNFGDLQIVATNELNEETLLSLNQQGHEIDVFGIGTHLVTCQSQPALGCIYKLAEINGQPRIKLSQDSGKVTIPGCKNAYRLTGREGYPLADIMLMANEKPPESAQRILCCHPFQEARRTYITPSEVIPLYNLVWDGKITGDLPSLQALQQYTAGQLKSLRADHLRRLNPTPYKVCLSEKLYEFMHKLWKDESPVGEIL